MVHRPFYITHFDNSNIKTIFVRHKQPSLTQKEKMKKTELSIDNQKLQLSSEILRALAHPLRIKILEFIDQHDTINVNKIYNNLKLEQSITSQHLRILRQAGIVYTKREGKFIYYKINYPRVYNVTKAVGRFSVAAV